MEENNNLKKEPKKFQVKVKLRTLIIIVTIIVILLASNVFAGVMGYGNIFFVIKNLVTTGTLEGKKDIFSDKEITISYATIKLLEDVELQVNKLQIRENNSTLIMQYKDNREEKTVIVLELSDENNKILCGKKAVDGEFKMNIDRQIGETEKISLKVYSDEEYVKTLIIDLESREIVVQGEEEVSKISEIELKKYLNFFALYNTDDFENINDLYIYIATNMAKEFGYETNTNEINAIVESMFDSEFEYNEISDSVKVLKTDLYKYNSKDKCYVSKKAFTDIEKGVCLKISDISFKDNIYTVDFIYCLPTKEDDNLEELDQYSATIELKYNKDSKYSKYQLVNRTKGSLIEKNEKVEIEKEEIEKVEKGFTKSGYTAVDEFLDGNSNDNGLIALEKIGENELKTEKHDGYYTYIDGWDNKYNIKEITGAKSEYAKTSNDGLDKLYKVTLNYINEKDKKSTMELGIIIGEFESYIIGNFDSFTGSTRFVRSYTDLYEESNDTEEVEECNHNYVVEKVDYNSGNYGDTKLDGTHILKCSKCGAEKEEKHKFEEWNDMSSSNSNNWSIFCTECNCCVYTNDENVVRTSGYKVKMEDVLNGNWVNYSAAGLKFEYPEEFTLEKIPNSKPEDNSSSVSVSITGVVNGIDDTNKRVSSSVRINIFEPMTVEDYYVDHFKYNKNGAENVNFSNINGMTWYQETTKNDDGSVLYTYSSSFKLGDRNIVQRITFLTNNPDNYTLNQVIDKFLGTTKTISY